MKKLITICLLLATSFTVKAQDIGFDETVSYINNIIKESNNVNYFNGNSREGKLVLGIVVDKAGKVDIYGSHTTYGFTDKYDFLIGSFNLFDVENYDTNQDNYLILLYNDSKKIGKFRNISHIAGLKGGKAFLHLRSLCTKAQDPFDK